MSSGDRYKKIVNGRMLKNYGSWMYCDKCNNTIGYLCYTTYQYFKFKFECNCGNVGLFELGRNEGQAKEVEENLIKRKNRLCCPIDDSPLFSVVEKNLKEFSYEIVCNTCLGLYKK